MSATTFYKTLEGEYTATNDVWTNLGDLALRLPPSSGDKQILIVLFNIPNLSIKGDLADSSAYRIMIAQGRGQLKPEIIGYGSTNIMNSGTNFISVSINSTINYSDSEGAKLFVQWIGTGVNTTKIVNPGMPSANLTAIITD